MLSPKKVKYRKQHKGRRKGLASRGAEISFGSFGLQTIEDGWVTARQIEASRIAISRYIKRGGKVWIRIFPDKVITKKAAETRMGSGKAPTDHYAAVIKPGRILFELAGIDEATAKDAFQRAAAKLPIRTKFFVKD